MLSATTVAASGKFGDTLISLLMTDSQMKGSLDEFRHNFPFTGPSTNPVHQVYICIVIIDEPDVDSEEERERRNQRDREIACASKQVDKALKKWSRGGKIKKEPSTNVKHEQAQNIDSLR